MVCSLIRRTGECVASRFGGVATCSASNCEAKLGRAAGLRIGFLGGKCLGAECGLLEVCGGSYVSDNIGAATCGAPGCFGTRAGLVSPFKKKGGRP